MTLIVPRLLVVAAVTNSDRTTSSHAFSLQHFTLFSPLGLMLMSLHFLGFYQVQAECKGKVFRGEILIYRGNYNSRGKRSYCVSTPTAFSDTLSTNFVTAQRNILQ